MVMRINGMLDRPRRQNPPIGQNSTSETFLFRIYSIEGIPGSEGVRQHPHVPQLKQASGGLGSLVSR